MPKRCTRMLNAKACQAKSSGSSPSQDTNVKTNLDGCEEQRERVELLRAVLHLLLLW